MKKRILSTLLALTMCLSLLPTAAFAEETDESAGGEAACTCETACTAETMNNACPVCGTEGAGETLCALYTATEKGRSGSEGQAYYDGTTMTTVPAGTTVTTVAESWDVTNDVTWNAGWYFVPETENGEARGAVEINGTLQVTGDVKLILEDQSVLVVKRGIVLAEGATLTIYRDWSDGYSQGIVSGYYQDQEYSEDIRDLNISGKGTLKMVGGELHAKLANGATLMDADGETYTSVGESSVLFNTYLYGLTLNSGKLNVSSKGALTARLKYAGTGNSAFTVAADGSLTIAEKDGTVTAASGNLTFTAGADNSAFTYDSDNGVYDLQNAGSSLVLSTGETSVLAGTYWIRLSSVGSTGKMTFTKGSPNKITLEKNGTPWGGYNPSTKAQIEYTTAADNTEFSIADDGAVTLTKGAVVQAVLSKGERCTGAVSGKTIENASTAEQPEVTVTTYADGYDIAWLEQHAYGLMKIGDATYSSGESAAKAYALYKDGPMKLVTGEVELKSGESVTVFGSDNVYKNESDESNKNVTLIVTDDYERVSVPSGGKASVNGRTYDNSDNGTPLILRYYNKEQAAKAGVPEGLALLTGNVSLAKNESLTLLRLETNGNENSAIVAALPLTNTAAEAMLVTANFGTNGTYQPTFYLGTGGSAKVGKATITDVVLPGISATLDCILSEGNRVGFVTGVPVTVNGVKYTPNSSMQTIIIDGDGNVITFPGTFTTNLTGGYTVTGTITDGNGGGLSNVVVKLTKDGRTPLSVPGTVTGADGTFTLSNVPEGLYDLVATYEDESGKRATVTLIQVDQEHVSFNPSVLKSNFYLAYQVTDAAPVGAQVGNLWGSLGNACYSKDGTKLDLTLTVDSNDKTVVPTGTDLTGKKTMNFKTTLTSVNGNPSDDQYSEAQKNLTDLYVFSSAFTNMETVEIYRKVTDYQGNTFAVSEMAMPDNPSEAGNGSYLVDADGGCICLLGNGYKQVEYTIVYTESGNNSGNDNGNNNNSGSGGGGGSSNTTSSTVTNPNGSTTTTTTNKVTGTVTETTKNPNGVTGSTVTDKNGNVTDISAKVPASAVKDGETVTIPVDAVKPADKSENATEIKVDVPTGGATVEIPVKNPTAGTVVVIVDKNGNETIVPGSKVTENGIEVTLPEDATIKVIDNSKNFDDVRSSDYFADAVKWASARNITGGLTERTFAPHASCTRAQIVTFLWRAAGSPEPKAASSFTDVSADAYYAKAVAWAVENGITNGFADGTFGVNTPCTRAQAVAFLFRYAAANGMEAVTLQELVSGFSDADSVPGYALSAFNWALAGGIVTGNNGNLMPNNTCTRAQIVTFLYRLLGK